MAWVRMTESCPAHNDTWRIWKEVVCFFGAKRDKESSRREEWSLCYGQPWTAARRRWNLIFWLPFLIHPDVSFGRRFKERKAFYDRGQRKNQHMYPHVQDVRILPALVNSGDNSVVSRSSEIDYACQKKVSTRARPLTPWYDSVCFKPPFLQVVSSIQEIWYAFDIAQSVWSY